MYQVGDWIFYGNIGACQVVDIDEKEIPGMDKKRLYYTLHPLSNDCSISTPANSEKVFMRPIISRDEAVEVMETMPGMTVDAYYDSARQLSDHYEAALNTHDCHALVRMTMSIYTKRNEAIRQKKKLGAVDEKFMRRAEDLLFGELAVALGAKRSQVQDYITERLPKEA